MSEPSTGGAFRVGIRLWSSIAIAHDGTRSEPMLNERRNAGHRATLILRAPCVPVDSNVALPLHRSTTPEEASVVKARTLFTLFIISLGTVAATASCGSDEATGGGAAGDAGGSILGGGATGRAGTTGRAGATAGGGEAASNGGAGNNGPGPLGAMCAGDIDCAQGLTCIPPDSTDFGSGGPSLGMCTMACTSDAVCGALAPGAGCINFGTQAAPKAFCLEGCTQGGDATAFDTKCQGRPDFACSDFSASAVPDPFCVPRCRADIECGPGLFCSRRSGLCSATKGTGDPAGTACDPMATTSTCQGVCVHFASNDMGVCAELCSGFLPCMYGGADGQKPGGLCSGALSQTFGPVDEGFCEPNCACSGDCKFPDHLCRKWPTAEANFKSILGADGMCYPTVLNSVELTCGEGGAGGADTGAGGAGGAAGAN